MELASRRRRSLAGRQAASSGHDVDVVVVDTDAVTKRRTRSVARMDVDNVALETTATNSSPLHPHHHHHHHHQQQQQQADAEAETKETSSAADQSQISAAEQPDNRDDDGTVEATTSDSTAESKHETDDDDADDNDLVIDATAADDDQETKPPTAGMNSDQETRKTLSLESPPKSSEDSATTNVFSNTSVRDDQVEDEGDGNRRESSSMQVETEREQLAAVGSGCVTDVEVKSSGTEERTAAERETDTDNDVNTPHHVQQQQQPDQQQTDDSSTATDQAARTVMMSDSGKLTSEDCWRRTADGDQIDDENEEQDGVDDDRQSAIADGRNAEEDLEAETSSSSGRQHQVPETAVEDLTERPMTESALEGERSVVEDLTKTGVGEVIATTPVRTVHSDDDDQEVSVSSPPSRPPPPPTALIYPVEGPPVPVISVTCGDWRAEFHVDRLVEALGPVSNSVGTSRTSLCVRTVVDPAAADVGAAAAAGVWMTPNQFQRASGRGTARDWKRSMKHHGVSLKSLLSKAVLSFDAAAPGCRCNLCSVRVATSSNYLHVLCIISSSSSSLSSSLFSFCDLK